MVLMYHGEPGREPGVRAKFRRWIPFEEIPMGGAPFELPVYLAFSIRREASEAEYAWREEGGKTFEMIEIASLYHRIVSTSTSQPESPDTSP